jgi:hypothetical protein
MSILFIVFSKGSGRTDPKTVPMGVFFYQKLFLKFNYLFLKFNYLILKSFLFYI